MINLKNVNADIKLIKRQSPVVHNITNLVAINFTANALLALGASPIMAHATEELAEILSISKSLLLNIGTLDQQLIGSMLPAQKIAKANKIPIVLDPVGSGVSNLRSKTTKQLLNSGYHSIKRKRL